MKNQQLTFEAHGHTYSLGNKQLIGVTRTLDVCGLLPDWMKNEEAAERGRRVHKACAILDLHEIDPKKNGALDWDSLDDEDAGYVAAWVEAKRELKFIPQVVELSTHCADYGIAGTPDRRGNLMNRGKQQRYAVLDLKSNKQGVLNPAVAYQLAAYAYMVRPDGLIERIAVALRPDGKFKVQTYRIEDYASDLADFLAMVRVARLKERINGR